MALGKKIRKEIGKSPQSRSGYLNLLARIRVEARANAGVLKLVEGPRELQPRGIAISENRCHIENTA